MTERDPQAAAAAFWEWSVGLYANDDVRDALLQLQDRFRMDVNLTLWCLWSAKSGYRLDAEAVGRLAESVDGVARYGVARLREVRRFLTAPKPGFASHDLAALRTRLLDAELFAEKLIQRRLAEITIAQFAPSIEPDEHWAHAARQHFRNVGSCLEKPILLVDEDGPGTPADLFQRVLEAASSEDA